MIDTRNPDGVDLYMSVEGEINPYSVMPERIMTESPPVRLSPVCTLSIKDHKKTCLFRDRYVPCYSIEGGHAS